MGSTPIRRTMSSIIKFGIYMKERVAGLTVLEAIAEWSPPPNIRAYDGHKWVPLNHVILDGQVIEVHMTIYHVYIHHHHEVGYCIADATGHDLAPQTWGFSQEISF